MWSMYESASTTRMLLLILLLRLFCLVTSVAIDLAEVNSSNPNNSTSAAVSRSSSAGQQTATGCPNCITVTTNKKLAERLKLDAIKSQILSKLNLPAKPNITSPIPKELIQEALRKAHLEPNINGDKSHYNSFLSPDNFYQLHDSLQAEESDNLISSTSSDDYFGRTSEIIAFAEPGKKVNDQTLLIFMPPHEPHRVEVTAASFWLQIRLRNLPRNWHHLLRDHIITIYIFRIADETRDEINNTNISNHLELVTSHKFRVSRPGWKHINVQQAVQKWFSEKNPLNKLTLLVDCVGCDSLVDIALFEDAPPANKHHTHNQRHKPNIRHFLTNNGQSGYRPFMIIATKPKPPRRSRRHALTCDTQTSQCCKQTLFVSFKQLGWDDWIIAPKGYNANYCMGDCSKRRTPDTLVHFHSHVIEEYRNKNPYASITPCCAPTKLSSISLIYFDPDLNIIKADLPKMVVDECGCT